MAKKPVKKKPANNGNGNSNGFKNKAIIKVVGVGGGGGNAISRMRERFVRGIDFIAINTDAQDLDFCDVHKKIYIGKTATRGLGTGMNPELGRLAAEENRQEIAEALSGADLVFITAGLGGGTGSGASPVVAEVAKELGALTIAVVTKPFSFEGGQRVRIAEEALSKIKEKVDTHIIIPNDKIFEIIGKDTSISKAFEAIDSILNSAVQGIAELIAMPGIINVDFADVKTIMRESGPALVGIGMAIGKDRGINAVKQVLNFPLLEVTIDGAKGVLFSVSGGRDMKMAEINDVARMIVENIDPAARVIFGAYYDRKVKQGKLKVTLIATGFGISAANASAKTTEMRASSLFNEGVAGLANGMTERNEVRISEPKIKTNPIIRLSKKEEGELSGKEEPPTKKKTTEIWDIPAFLRKRKDK